MPEPRVSIMIITYNQLDFIEETVGSALEQDYANLEVVVADDGSTTDIAITPQLDDFIHLLSACDGLELCFLNACESGDLGRSIVEKLPHLRVICWEFKVGDRPASA